MRVNCCKKSRFLQDLEFIFRKYGLEIIIKEYQYYYAIWVFNGFYNNLVWFEVENSNGEICRVDVLNNNNQHIIKGIYSSKGEKEYLINSALDEILNQIFAELSEV